MTSLNLPPRFDVCAVGNALVDVIADATDDFLKEHKIAKGGMTLIDADRAAILYDHLGPAVEMSGGSVANTVAGIASLGGQPAYMGKVKSDQLGAIFRHDLHAQGVHFSTPPAPEPSATAPTGRCLILVTPDAQRSMNTYLGAAVEFSEHDLQHDIIAASQITYLEGYLFDRPAAQQAFLRAAMLVHSSQRKLALTLSDTFCVERHRQAFLSLIKNDVDILFANHHELMALYQTSDLQSAISSAREHCEIVCTTRSEKGAIITRGQETHEVAAAPVPKVVDTTGAGDLFAAGFLYGVTQNKSLPESGRIGALAAAEIISHYGPRPQKKLKDLL